MRVLTPLTPLTPHFAQGLNRNAFNVLVRAYNTSFAFCSLYLYKKSLYYRHTQRPTFPFSRL